MLGRDEPADGRHERDRRRVGEGQPVELVHAEDAHPIQEPGDGLRRVGLPAPRARRALRGSAWLVRGVTRTAATADDSRQATLPVVPSPEGRVAQPVMGDIDPLGRVKAIGTGHVGMVLSEQGTPGKLDRLRAGGDGHLQAGVQVVGRERRAWRHAAHRSGVGLDRPLP